MQPMVVGIGFDGQRDGGNQPSVVTAELDEPIREFDNGSTIPIPHNE